MVVGCGIATKNVGDDAKTTIADTANSTTDSSSAPDLMGSEDSVVAADTAGIPNDTAVTQGDSAQPGDLAATDATVSDPGTHSAIHIVLPVQFSETMLNLDQFVAEKENLRWLLAKTESYVGDQRPKVTVLLSGQPAMLMNGKIFGAFTTGETFTKETLDGFTVLKELALAGVHQVGTAIGSTRYLNNGKWSDLASSLLAQHPCINSSQIVDPSLDETLSAWWSHTFWVDQLLKQISSEAKGLGTVSAEFPLDAKTRYLTIKGEMSSGNLQLDHGFSVEAWPFNQCFVNLFGHGIWNPWRPGTDGPLLDSPSNTSYVTIPYNRELGPTVNTETVYRDGSLAAHQREFLQLVLERRYEQTAGLPGQVWVFGTGLQLSRLDETARAGKTQREVLIPLLAWLNTNFVDSTNVSSSTARYATLKQTASTFEAWRQKNPEGASFSYDLQFANYKADEALYPYKLRTLARLLSNTHFTAFMSDLPNGVYGATFEACPSTQSPLFVNNCYWRATKPLSEAQCFQSNVAPSQDPSSGTLCTTQTLHVFWAAKETIVDLAKVGISAAVTFEGVDGTKQTAALQITVGPKPLIVVPVQ